MLLSSVRITLKAATLVLASVLAVACGDEHGPGPRSRDRIEFGIWTPEASGELRFEATDEVPYVAEQAFGWRRRAAVPDEPVKWVEQLELPAPPESWEGVAESPNVTVSEDGRKATTFGASLPGDEFIGNVWYVSPGDPLGDYRISIELEDGSQASFRFRLATPKDGRVAATPGEVI